MGEILRWTWPLGDLPVMAGPARQYGRPIGPDPGLSPAQSAPDARPDARPVPVAIVGIAERILGVTP